MCLIFFLLHIPTCSHCVQGPYTFQICLELCIAQRLSRTIILFSLYFLMQAQLLKSLLGRWSKGAHTSRDLIE